MDHLLANMIGTERVRVWTLNPQRCVVGMIADVTDGVVEVVGPPDEQTWLATAHITRVEWEKDSPQA